LHQNFDVAFLRNVLPMHGSMASFNQLKAKDVMIDLWNEALIQKSINVLPYLPAIVYLLDHD